MKWIYLLSCIVLAPNAFAAIGPAEPLPADAKLAFHCGAFTLNGTQVQNTSEIDIYLSHTLDGDTPYAKNVYYNVCKDPKGDEHVYIFDGDQAPTTRNSDGSLNESYAGSPCFNAPGAPFVLLSMVTQAPSDPGTPSKATLSLSSLGASSWSDVGNAECQSVLQ